MSKDIDYSKLDWQPIEQPKSKVPDLKWEPIGFNPVTESFDPIKGLAEAGMSLASGALVGAPLGLGAGIGALINRAAFGSQEDPKETMAKYAKMGTYEPRSKAGKAIVKPIHSLGEYIGEKSQKGGEYVARKYDSPIAGALTEATGQTLAGLLGAKVAPKIPGAIQKGAEIVSKPISKPYGVLSGKEAIKAKESAVKDIESLMQKGTAEKTQQAKKIQDQAIEAERRGDFLLEQAEKIKKDAESSGQIVSTKDYQAQGNLAKTEYNKAINAEKAYRETQVQADKKAISDIVNEKQMAGKPLLLNNTIQKIKQIREKMGHLPPIERELTNFSQAIKPKKAQVAGQPEPVNLIDPKTNLPFEKPPQEPPRLNYDQIEITRRYFDDIANDIGTERFESVVKNSAKEIADALRDDMRSYVGQPFDTYLENYRVNSKNLKSVSEKLGKLMYETPDATLTVPTEKLPGRIFSDLDTAKQFQDILESARKKAPETYVGDKSAQAKVVQMMEDYLKEKFRSSGKAGEAGLKEIQSAELRPMLENLAPELKVSFTKEFENQVRLLNQAQRLAEQGNLSKSQAAAMQTESAQRINAINDINKKIENAKIKFDQKGGLNDALSEFNSALEQAKNAGVINNESYKLALDSVYKAKNAAEVRQKALQTLKALTAIGGIYGGWSVVNAIGAAGR